jgi:hypothetical protein
MLQPMFASINKAAKSRNGETLIQKQTVSDSEATVLNGLAPLHLRPVLPLNRLLSGETRSGLLHLVRGAVLLFYLTIAATNVILFETNVKTWIEVEHNGSFEYFKNIRRAKGSPCQN